MTNTVYEVVVTRQRDGVQIDHFFTGYPERDIPASHVTDMSGSRVVPVRYTVSVSEIEDNPFEDRND